MSAIGLDGIPVGAALADDIRRAIEWSSARGASYGSYSDRVGARERRWTITLRDEVVVELALFTEGAWDELVSEYEQLVATMTARFGTPTEAPPDEDAHRDVDLDDTGLPDDRYWHLRSRAWASQFDPAGGALGLAGRISIYKVWPATLRLRMSADVR